MNFSLQLPFGFRLTKNGDELESRLIAIEEKCDRIISILEKRRNRKLRPIFKWIPPDSIKIAQNLGTTVPISEGNRGDGGEMIRPVFRWDPNQLEEVA